MERPCVLGLNSPKAPCKELSLSLSLHSGFLFVYDFQRGALLDRETGVHCQRTELFGVLKPCVVFNQASE